MASGGLSVKLCRSRGELERESCAIEIFGVYLRSGLMKLYRAILWVNSCSEKRRC